MNQDQAGRKQRATRNDVARLSGVSTAVVSYVLNNGPRPVADSTRQRVMKAVAELNYRPNASAKALKLQRTNVLGLLVPDISNPFFAEFGKEVQNLAFAKGFSLILADTSLEPGRESAQVHSMIDRQVDGLIVFGIQDTSLIPVLISSGIPLVSMDWQLTDSDVPTVVVDDYRAAVEAVKHLIDHGHSRIAYIGGPDELLVSQDRLRGWVDAMTESFPETDLTPLQFSSPHTRAGGRDIGERLLKLQERPTALFIGADIQAVGTLHALSESGARVPQDIAIVSFDGTQESEYSNPPLSAIRLPVEMMALEAIRKLLDNAGHELGLHSVIPHKFIARRSCGCL